MADERGRLEILNEIIDAEKRIRDIRADASKTAQEQTDLIEEEKKSTKELGTELKRVNQERRSGLADSESALASMGSMYNKLTVLEKDRLKNMVLLKTQENTLTATQESSINRIADINRSIAQLSSEDIVQRAALTDEYDELLSIAQSVSAENKHLVDNLEQQNVLANQYANMTKGQKEQLEAQLEAYNGIKKTIGGILDTAAILTSGPGGLLGMSLIGAGKFIGKMGEVRGQLGGIAEFGTTALAFFDDNAVANAKELASQFGGINNVSGQLQASTSLISVNMGISGVEAAGLIGSFARLNGNSQETALNLTKASQEFAAQNGLIPGALMEDLAANTEAFALFGKDGGKNMIQAAGAAAKMGVSLKTMTGLADNLLDFENSINAEMELGAMLGKDINLDRARGLAFAGDLAGATQETLNALGGVDAFNKMDYFSKKKTAELMGTSVEELQKMVTNQEQAATMGGKINATFSLLGETIDGGLNKYLGTSLEALGGMVMAGAQLGGSFAQMGFDVKGMASGALGKIKGFFGGGKSPIESVTENAGQATGGGAQIAPGGEASEGGLKSLAEGLKEMGSGKVLLGALNLIPTAAGLALMVIGIPSMMALGAFGANAGIGLEFIGVGLQAMGNPQALLGALALSVAAVGFTLMTAGVIGLGAIAVGGVAAGAGLIGLTAGLVAIGTAAATGIPFLGVALIAAFGVSLIPLTFALSLLAPLVESVGNVIIGTIGAIASGISTIVGSIGQFITQVLPLFNLENAAGLLAMAGGFAALSLSLMGFGVASLMAIPGMIAVGAFLALGGGDLLGGGGEAGGGGGSDGMGELIAEIKGLRADLSSGKIGVNMDGQKVTSKITSVVDKGSRNSYAK
jgi:hypothetical protein